MTQLATYFLCLIFAAGTTTQCLADDKVDGPDDDFVTISYTTSGGTDAIVLKGPKSMATMRSVTFSDGDKEMTITPRDNGIEMRIGTFVVLATELRLSGMPTIKAAKALSVQTRFGL